MTYFRRIFKKVLSLDESSAFAAWASDTSTVSGAAVVLPFAALGVAASAIAAAQRNWRSCQV